MNDPAMALEALKLISDWAKWLITIETGAIALIGAIIRAEFAGAAPRVRTLAAAAVCSFVISITAAAMLLLTLPDIAQRLQPNVDVWLTSDTVAGRILGLNTQALALIESLFFGVGLLCFAALILTRAATPAGPAVSVWDGQARPQGPIRTVEDDADEHQ